MKPYRLIFALIVSVALVTACKRESSDNVAFTSSVVVFPEAGISVDVGAGWKRIAFNPGPPTCAPTLYRSNIVVGACLFAEPDTMQEAIDAAHTLYVAHTNSIKDSWHQVGFTTDSGLAGQHISFMETKIKGENKIIRQRHEFFAQRKDGRLVSISYDAPVGDDADAVQQMIQRSFKLQ